MIPRENGGDKGTDEERSFRGEGEDKWWRRREVGESRSERRVEVGGEQK